MAKREVIEFQCDVCGKSFQLDKKNTGKKPLREVSIPSKNYDCEGRNYSKGTRTVDMCEQCFDNYWNYVQDRYDASDYFGIKIKESMKGEKE